MHLGARSLDHAYRWDEWRLPKGIAPTTYNLTFQVEWQEPWQVHGLEYVGIVVTHSTRCIVVHVDSLAVTDARVGDGKGIPARWRYNEALHQLIYEKAPFNSLSDIFRIPLSYNQSLSFYLPGNRIRI